MALWPRKFGEKEIRIIYMYVYDRKKIQSAKGQKDIVRNVSLHKIVWTVLCMHV